MLRPIDTSTFFDQGAIFASGDSVHCFWGHSVVSSQRPDGPAVFRRPFFSQNEACWVEYEHYRECSTEACLELFGIQETEPKKLSWSLPGQSEFKAHFQKIQSWMSQGRLQKGVPFVTAEAEGGPSSRDQLSHFLFHGLKAHGGWLYGCWDGCHGMVGRSPEMLIEQRGDHSWQTVALAGTTPWDVYQRDPEAFMDDAKESWEQGLVTQFLQETLSPLGTVDICGRQTVQAGSLAHLKTEVCFESDPQIVGDPSLETLVDHLHPTPALGCYPKENWRSHLMELDPKQSRGLYGAPFGVSLSRQTAEIIVAIRNIRWKGAKLYLSTGCGLVKDSVLDKEWKELDLKRNSVRKLFQV